MYWNARQNLSKKRLTDGQICPKIADFGPPKTGMCQEHITHSYRTTVGSKKKQQQHWIGLERKKKKSNSVQGSIVRTTRQSSVVSVVQQRPFCGTKEQQIHQHWNRRTSCVAGSRRAVQRLNSMEEKRGKPTFKI